MLSNVNIYILQKIIHHHKKVYIHTKEYKNNCYLSHKHYPVSYASLTHRYVGTMRKTLDNSGVKTVQIVKSREHVNAALSAACIAISQQISTVD